MRLFIAVNFPNYIKDSLMNTINQLKDNCTSGNFTKYDNLHLTIAFLGEIPPSKISKIKADMDNVSFSQFELILSGIGRFKRTGGDIYWYGIDRCVSLNNMHEQLCNNLRSSGFEIEDRKFSPHLTLGRQVVPNNNFNINAFSKSTPILKTTVSSFSLMKSERINGKLTYTELYRKNAD